MRWSIRKGRSRGAAEVGLALTVAALVAGAVIGNGLAATNLLTSDGLTWLGDDDRGTAVQIDPTTGRPQNELKVAPPGNHLDIGQRDGLLVINDTTTGTITLIDVATLVATGRRTTVTSVDPARPNIEVLVDNNQIYLVDRPAGAVHRIDPRTAVDVGPPWLAGTAIADAVLDGSGTVWALGTDARLHSLNWSPQTQTLNDVSPVRHVDGTGPDSQLVPHDTGVTVFAPESNRVVRVGTANDVTLPAPQLDNPLRVAPRAPSDLVPASLPGTATVLIVRNSTLTATDVAPFGCPSPGRPVVHGNRVYVPCLGSGRVIVLSAEGRHQPPDIELGAGADPQLVLDDGNLVIHAPGRSDGVIVEPDGTTRTVETHDDTVPPRPPNPPPAPTPTPTPRNTSRGPDNPAPTTTNPTTTSPTTTPPAVAGPSPSSTPTSGPSNGPTTTVPPTTVPPTTNPPTVPPTTNPPGPTDPPTGVSATPLNNGTVVVSWNRPAGQPDVYHVIRSDDATEVATVGGSATQATITTVAPGTTVGFFVVADYAGTLVPSAQAGPVTVFTTPGVPNGVVIAVTGTNGNSTAFASALTVRADWSAAADNGSPVSSYVATVYTDRGYSTGPLSVGYTTGGVSIPCGGDCSGISVSVTVQAVSAAGTGGAAGNSTSYTEPGPVVTSFGCGPGTSFKNVRCTVSVSAPGTIQWDINGTHRTGFDNRTTITTACAATIFITVTITNPYGTATESTDWDCSLN